MKAAVAGPALRMRWEELLFLHWAVDVALVEAVLPRGLRPDLHEGRAWVGIVPFRMRGVCPASLFPVPWLSDFLELNVRTYAVAEDGRRGVWFTSLACNQPIAVGIARRLFHLPYVHADMRRGAMYHCRRRGGAESEFCYEPLGNGGEPAPPGSLEEFLIERYVLFCADRRGRIHAGEVKHAPYRIREARVQTWSWAPALEDGWPHPGRPPDHALVAAPVSVTAWPVRRVGTPIYQA